MADYLNGDIAAVAEMGHLFSLPEAIEKIISPSRSHESKIPVDILDTSNQYIFYLDLPGLSKSDIQVSIEGGNTLVIRSNGKKRKREDGEEGDVCKYIRLERRAPQKLVRKFKLPENCNLSAIAAKCENGVVTVVVEKLPPPKSKTVSVTIS